MISMNALAARIIRDRHEGLCIDQYLVRYEDWRSIRLELEESVKPRPVLCRDIGRPNFLLFDVPVVFS